MVGPPLIDKLAIGEIVKHVALVRMSLAPGAFMRDDVLRFGKIGHARIATCQVTRINQNPVRDTVVHVAAVIVRC